MEKPMSASLFTCRAESPNAKAGAIALAVAGFMTMALSHTAVSFAPIRILALATAVFAAWAFCDEMGLNKPLNRAGFVCLVIAAMCKVQISLGVGVEFVGRYYLLYAAFLLLAVLFWCVALLHRQRELKVVGAIGALATLTPLVAIIAAHLAVGVGAVMGVGSLLAATDGNAPTDLSFGVLVERIFGLWSYAAAWLLWRGHIVNKPAAR